MNWLWLLLTSLKFAYLVNGDDNLSVDGRCLTDLPEVNPKKYFHLQGKSLEIKIETSDRITHQLSTWVFYFFIKEVIGYTKLKIVKQKDNFEIEDVIQRLTDITKGSESEAVANSTINLEVWIPPDYDTYVTDFVKECGSLSPPGRFGWFIPINMTTPIKNYYNPDHKGDIKSIHWRHFRERKYVSYFEIKRKELDEIEKRGYNRYKNTNEYVCPETNCTKSMFVPDWCKNGEYCAVLLTSDWSAMKFVAQHIRENALYVKVLFLGDNLLHTVEYLESAYRTRSDQSLVILSWTPSDVILYEGNFVTVSFENCERLNFTHSNSVGYKYEMHRLVKVAWSKVEKSAKPLYETLRSFKFEVSEYEHLLSLYQENRHKALDEIACTWLRQNKNTWLKWKKSRENVIYIGGIFPMSGSSYNGKGIVQAALMARNAINRNNTILADYNLHILVTNGMCRADNVMKNFIDFIVDQNYYNNLVGVLGPACSDTVEPLAGVSKHYHIMVISYSAEGSSFSNREKYPYFFRTIGENKHYKHVYLELFRIFNWKRMAALTEDGQKYTEYISLMQDDLEKDGVTFIANKKFPRERQTEPMTRYLEDLKSKRARIIIADVVDEIARQVMCEAFKLQMTAAEGYVWFLPMWLNRTWYNTDYFNANESETVNCTTAEMIKAITGYFAMTHAYYAPDNQTMQENNKTVGTWIKEYKDYSKGISDYGGFAYDAVWVYALALDKLSKTDPEALSDLHSENTTIKLVKLIEQTDFYGVSGRIKFRGGPSRFSIINILQWYNHSTHLIGEFYPNLTDDKPEILGGNLILHKENIKWFTPDGNVPEDGTLPPPVCAIESIAKAFNVECQTAVIILNVIVAMFLGITVMGVCLYLKYKYDKRVKVQKAYMEKLGLRYERKYTTDLEEFEVCMSQVELTRKLGEGAFGTVYGGQVYVPAYGEGVFGTVFGDILGIPYSGWCPVAVKTLKAGSSTEDKIDFLTEADNMKHFDHKNVIKLLGVVTKTSPLATIMEYCLLGDLKNFLLARRLLANTNANSSEEITPKQLTNMALDIARGLSYLAEMKYVHRDLACRNCLVNAQRIVKIGDFGMTRPMNDSDCYQFTRKGMLPVRWMAPESLLSGVFSTATDIWSYGVVLYEIITFGSTPWYGKANTEVVELVKEGGCLEVPKGAKPQLEGLMKSCWMKDPKERPAASSIVNYLANAPKLLSPCVDVPLQSISLGDADGESNEPDEPDRCFLLSKLNFRKSSTNSRFSSPKSLFNPKGSRPTALGPLSTDRDESVSIPLESYCPKAPLLGSKSTNSLINFGKFNMQSSRRDSGCHGEDDGFANTPANGYINKNNEDPFASSGSEYIPSEDELSTENGNATTSDPDEQVKKGRKRGRKEGEWKKNIRKYRRNTGQAYKSVSGKEILAKNFLEIICACNNKRHLKIEPERQKTIFKNFYDLQSFDLQSCYLYSQIKVVNKNRIYTKNAVADKREKTRLYYLPSQRGEDLKVCKTFFKKVLQVSDGRLTRVLKNKATAGTPPTDKRGRHIPHNKTSLNKVNEVKTFIEKFPSYLSHYTLHKNPNRKFLSPHLSLTKMYELYKEETCEPVSHWVFSEIFNKEFNLHFHVSVSDSCKRCDLYEAKIKAAEGNPEVMTNLTSEKQLHLRKADSARNGLRNDALLAQTDDCVTTITFDLMQTLPTPVLTTGICYYKRQMWTYCFGVHNMGTGKVCMFMWDESIASRGPQEIGSCLLYYIRNFVTTKNVIMYSDQCGGQNRNIKLALLCNLIVGDPMNPVKVIDHKFLVSEHSYLPCDEDFGLIKKQQKFHPEIYIPSDWKNVVLNARKKNKFQVVNMTCKEFFSTKALEKNITNRKVSSTGDKVEWLKIQWLRYNKEEPFKISYKYTNNEFMIFNKVDISKRTTENIFNLELLYPDGNCITPAKKKDLLDLLPFVPPIHHSFYTQLKTSLDAQDTLDPINLAPENEEQH